MADNLVPTTDGAQDLGTAAKQWGALRAKTIYRDGVEVNPANYDAAGAATGAVSTHVGLTDPHTQYQKESEKGAAGGYASLDAAGLVPSSQMPPVAISEFLGEVATQVAMLLLVGEKGDWCIRTDLGQAFILIAGTGGVLNDWKAMPSPTAPVLSVNGETGAVSLDYSDVGAASTTDVRLSDARTPTAHAASHATAGGDAVAPSAIGAEPALGNPLVSGYALVSTTGGVRSWAAASADLSTVPLLLPTTSARNVIQPSGAAVVPLTVKGAAAQTANLLELQNSAGASLLYFNPAGSGDFRIYNPADTTRYLKIYHSANKSRIDCQSMMELQVQGNTILSFASTDSTMGSTIGLWDMGGLLLKRETAIGQATGFGGPGMTSADCYISSSKGYDATNRRNANPVYWITPDGISPAATDTNAGNGGDIWLKFGTGGIATGTGVNGRSGKLIITRAGETATLSNLTEWRDSTSAIKAAVLPNGSVQTASDAFFYMGDSATDGSWRIGRSGTGLVMERRESGSWVAKSTIQA
jgi:hypothetical protein